MAYIFSGGISIKAEKKFLNLTAKPFAEPPQVAIPLYGCKSLVSAEDFVDIGQAIGEGDGVSVHASVSGKVIAVESRKIAGGRCDFVVIKNDCRHTVVSTLDPVTKPLSELGAEELITRIKNAGIKDAKSGEDVGKALEAVLGKAKRVIINCADSEPWQATSYRCMSEQTEAVIKGIKLLIYVLGVRKADIVVEESKKALISKIESHITDKALIELKLTTSKHPISINGRLIYAVYNKRLPVTATPCEAGYAVFTPETAAAVYRSLATGMPMIHKRVSVGGDGIDAPQNLIVPIGTSIKDIAEFCGGTKKRVRRIVKGGALTGKAASEDEVVEKTTDAVLFLGKTKKKATSCIRCGRCIDVCPVGLTPSLLAAFGEKGIYDECISLGAKHCSGCGCCAYVCPSAIPIVHYINEAKAYNGTEREEENEQE